MELAGQAMRGETIALQRDGRLQGVAASADGSKFTEEEVKTFTTTEEFEVLRRLAQDRRPSDRRQTLAEIIDDPHMKSITVGLLSTRFQEYIERNPETLKSVLLELLNGACQVQSQVGNVALQVRAGAKFGLALEEHRFTYLGRMELTFSATMTDE